MAHVEPRYNKDGEIVRYRIRAYIGKDRNNRYIRISKLIPRPTGLSPKKEEKEVARIADAWEQEQRELFEKSNQAAPTQKDKETLESFIDNHWLPKHVKDGNHTPDTIAFYTSMASDIKAYFRSAHPGIKLCQISKEEVLDYLKYMRENTKTKSGKKYGKTTIQHHFSTLRNILSYAVYLDYIKEDPCKRLKASDRPRREDKEIDFLESEEAIEFLTCLDSDKEKEYWNKKARNSHLYWKCLVNALMLTGLRRGELVGLQWQDLDEKAALLKIRRNVTVDASNKSEKDPSKKIHVGELKNKRIGKVPISNHLLSLLQQLKAEQNAKFKNELRETDYIFCRSDNKELPIYPTEPTRLLKKFIARHGLKNISPHDLRHTAASLAIESGANIKQVQKLLRHKDAATTLKFYTGITEQTQRSTVEGIESTLRPPKDNKSQSE